MTRYSLTIFIVITIMAYIIAFFCKAVLCSILEKLKKGDPYEFQYLLSTFYVIFF